MIWRKLKLRTTCLFVFVSTGQFLLHYSKLTLSISNASVLKAMDVLPAPDKPVNHTVHPRNPEMLYASPRFARDISWA